VVREIWRRTFATAWLAVAVATLTAAIAVGGSLAGEMSADSARQDVIPAGPFVGNFDVPAPGWQQYSGLQREIDRPEEDSFALVNSPVRQGSSAARFTVRHGYSRWGHNEDTEVVLFGGEKPGDDYWYAWSTLFPQNWQAPHSWGIFIQWHANLGTSPIISLNARSDSADLNLLSGITDEDVNRQEVDRGIPILSSLAKGQWNDFLLHVRWSTQHDGLVDLYHRVKGAATMRRVAFARDIPTFQFTREGRGVGTYLLFGLYRGSLCPQPTQISCTSLQPAQPPNVVFHDGFARARSYEQAARSAFPGQLPKLVANAPSEATTNAAPLRLTARASSSGRVVDRGASLVVDAGALTARVSGARDDRDTAVATYRIRQRGTLVVRYRLDLPTRGRLSGNAVVTQVRDSRGRVVAELYVSDKDRMISLYSPPGALRRTDLNLSTNVAAIAGRVRAIELRLSQARLVLVIDRKLRLVVDVRGPRRGATLASRLGIHHYDGDGTSALRVSMDEVEVGVAD
jgi:hypothetical protein